ncbi:MAG TPA: hypothetical protein VLF94_03710 [Chlamydiales bacterium]|nr:hypothetical protein [Chlamydiales bacterium]
MKITSTILSIPPYISTTWGNISSLHVKEERGAYTLIVILKNRVQIEVPGLDKQGVDTVFEAHAHYAEESAPHKPTNPIDGPFSFSLPLRADGPIDTLGAGMQHNPEQAGLPPIPPDVLKKLTLIARAFGLEDASALPKAEPHCNCVYCQVARALQDQDGEPVEEVTEQDLTFRDWEIKKTGDHLYIVTNPLDANEHYTVFLGTPIGCTCGSQNCEHIRTVLNS